MNMIVRRIGDAGVNTRCWLQSIRLLIGISIIAWPGFLFSGEHDLRSTVLASRKKYLAACSTGDVDYAIEVTTKRTPTPATQTYRFAWDAQRWHLHDRVDFWFDGKVTTSFAPGKGGKNGFPTGQVTNGQSLSLKLTPWHLTGRLLPPTNVSVDDVLANHSTSIERTDDPWPNGVVIKSPSIPADNKKFNYRFTVWLDDELLLQKVRTTYETPRPIEGVKSLDALQAAYFELEIEQFDDIITPTQTTVRFPERAILRDISSVRKYQSQSIKLGAVSEATLTPQFPSGTVVDDRTGREVRRYVTGSQKDLEQSVSTALAQSKKAALEVSRTDTRKSAGWYSSAFFWCGATVVVLGLAVGVFVLRWNRASSQ